jgi:hypothetical protein
VLVFTERLPIKWRVFALLALGCASARIPHVPGDPPPAVADPEAEKRYQAVLERYTSAQGVYDNLDTKLFFRATWQAPALVAARVRRQAQFKAWPAAEVEPQLAAEQAKVGDGVEFFLAVHANDYRFDDFERPTSMWRMVLVAGEDEVSPTLVERLGRSNVEMRSYYSYMESFWVGYRVRFPKRSFGRGEQFRLKLASALGKAELTYTAD